MRSLAARSRIAAHVKNSVISAAASRLSVKTVSDVFTLLAAMSISKLTNGKTTSASSSTSSASKFKRVDPYSHCASELAFYICSSFLSHSHRILFRQHLEDDAFTWYSDLDSNLKQDWPALMAAFLPAYAITTNDAQTKKFELRVKLANLEQGNAESDVTPSAGFNRSFLISIIPTNELQ